jgi:KaiC/GvpD/RAD55 family RecA-like ATPase
VIEITLEQRFLILLSTSRRDLSKWCTKLNAAFFPTVVEQDICQWICEHFIKFRTCPSPIILKHQMASVCEQDKNRNLLYGRYEAVINAITSHQPNDQEDEWIRTEFIGWLRQQSIKWTIAEAEVRIEQNEYKKKPESAEFLIKSLRDSINIVEDKQEEDYDFFQGVKNRVWPDRSHIAIPTGYKSLDFILRGGLIPGELMVVEGGAKVGKSAVLVNMAIGAMRRRVRDKAGLSVVYYTLELSTQQVADRFEANIADIIKTEIPKRRADVQQACDNFQYMQKCKLQIKKFNSSVTVDTIASHLDMLEMREDFKADLVIVDYADLMKPISSRKVDQRWVELASIYRDLRSLAGEKQFLCYTASQANKNAFEKELVDISDLAGAYEKAAIADLVISITRTKKERILNQAILYVAASRESEGEKKIPVTVDLARCRIEETAIPDDK